jgi:uncharacterized protein YeaO (DUF488 family)
VARAKEAPVLYTARKFDKAAWHGQAIEVSRTRRSFFAPSQELLDDYKAGRASWTDYERRYDAELQAKYAEAPQPFLDLIERAAHEDVTLTCWEKGDEDTVHCHRRLLRDFLATLARERGLAILPPSNP